MPKLIINNKEEDITICSYCGKYYPTEQMETLQRWFLFWKWYEPICKNCKYEPL